MGLCSALRWSFLQYHVFLSTRPSWVHHFIVVLYDTVEYHLNWIFSAMFFLMLFVWLFHFVLLFTVCCQCPVVFVVFFVCPQEGYLFCSKRRLQIFNIKIFFIIFLLFVLLFSTSSSLVCFTYSSIIYILIQMSFGSFIFNWNPKSCHYLYLSYFKGP